MTLQFSFVDYIYRGRTEREFEVEVTYSYTPGRPGSMWGPTPHPDDPAEIEIISVKHNGAEFDTTREEEQKLFERCEDRAAEDLAEYHAEMADYRAEDRAERLAMERAEELATASETSVPPRRAA